MFPLPHWCVFLFREKWALPKISLINSDQILPFFRDGAAAEQSDCCREAARVGGVMWRQFAGTSQGLPPRSKRMGLALDPLWRRAGLFQHRAQSSPPKPQPRMAAGPAIRGAEPQISSDSIGVVSSAVEFFEPKSPLRTMQCYRRAKPTVKKTFADLAPA